MAILTVEFGGLAAPLSEQLAGLIKDKKMLERLDLMATSITVCFIHSLIPESVASKARDRLMARIKDAIELERK
jgi:tellurite resistance protein